MRTHSMPRHAGLMSVLVGLATSGCLVSNLPPTARPIPKGEGTVAIQQSLSFDDDGAQGEGALLAALLGLAAGVTVIDVGFDDGVTDNLSVGALGGLSGTLTAHAKYNVIAEQALNVAVFGAARTYWIADVQLAHAGIVATFGRKIGVIIGGSLGEWWGQEISDAEDEAIVGYYGGGIGIDANSDSTKMRFMLEVQQHDRGEDDVTTFMLTTSIGAPVGK